MIPSPEKIDICFWQVTKDTSHLDHLNPFTQSDIVQRPALLCKGTSASIRTGAPPCPPRHHTFARTPWPRTPGR